MIFASHTALCLESAVRVHWHCTVVDPIVEQLQLQLQLQGLHGQLPGCNQMMVEMERQPLMVLLPEPLGPAKTRSLRTPASRLVISSPSSTHSTLRWRAGDLLSKEIEVPLADLSGSVIGLF
ncbi:hypothetical protein [Pseudomonas soli]|uniref:hypothetical protein n=1 Tax=Pseudomonas soli TaxID=1306993 RepID=UPI003DAA3E37